jgi:ADP-heptose:LPS heptosyltransferase
MVIARGHLGDLVTALPALRDLRAGYPDAHITLIANEYVRGALEGCPFVDEIVYGFGYQPRSSAQAAAMRLKLLARTAGRYDIAVSLRSSPPSSAILGLVSGARVRAGYRQPGLSGRLLTRDLGPEPRLQSNRLTNAAVVGSLRLEMNPVLPRLDWIPDAERERADQLVAERGITTGTRFATFQVAAHWGCYEWQSQKWAALADRLADRHGLKVLVVGTGEEFELRKFAELSSLSRVPTSVQGLTTLPMLFHIISRSALVIAADSALTQIAIAQGTPSVILFGIEPQVRNGPLPEEVGLMESVQYWEGPGRAPTPNAHCLFGHSQCHTANCRENSSFERITADEVYERAALVLERVRQSPRPADRQASPEPLEPQVEGATPRR